MDIEVALQGQLPHQAHWIYFHREAEDFANSFQSPEEDAWVAPDLVSSNVELNDLTDGIYLVHLYGQEARLYLWRVESSRAFYKTKGLIVFLGGVGEEEARKHFLAHSSML